MHIGFQCESVSEIKEKIKKNNIKIVEDVLCGKDGLKHLFLEDPEENLIEFSERSFE